MALFCAGNWKCPRPNGIAHAGGCGKTRVATSLCPKTKSSSGGEDNFLIAEIKSLNLSHLFPPRTVTIIIPKNGDEYERARNVTFLFRFII